MYIKRLRAGLEVADKVNGKFYKVTCVDSTNGIGTAVEMIMDSEGRFTGELGEGETAITERNALAFRIVNDPEPYPVPEGYYVLDGKLLRDGMPACETGDLILTRLLAVQRDFVILAAKKKDTKEGMAELMSYQVSRDRFYSLRLVPENTKLIGYVGEGNGKAVLAYSGVTEKEVKGKDGTARKARIFSQAGLIIITGGTKTIRYIETTPITLENAILKEVPGSNGKFEAFLPADEQEDEEGCLIPRKKTLWIKTDGDIQTALFEADGQIQVNWSHAYHEFVIRTRNMVMVPGREITISSPKVAELEGYDILIDITKEFHEYKLTFSDGEYAFKTLTSRSSMDRGCIVTVE